VDSARKSSTTSATDVNVCDALDIAPEPLRREVLKWRTVAARPRVTRRGMLVGKLAAVEPS
jgi:hypothetical protein